MIARSTTFVAALLAFAACEPRHHAPVQTGPATPPPAARVLHTGRLFVELRAYTADEQCIEVSSQRPLCFRGVRDALAESLVASLWPSFPEVRIKDRDDNLEPGDYLLLVNVELDALPPAAAGPGWSAGARGRWRLVRDGLPVVSEGVSSRSRSDFAYGRPLGVAAGEVVRALAFHIARQLSDLPEAQPAPPVPLPAVAARRTQPLLSASRD